MWKEIPGTTHLISEDGVVMNAKTGHILKQSVYGDYLTLQICDKLWPVHKLMAEMFLELREGYVVDHINRNKLDNRLCNLRIVTPSENRANCNVLSTNCLGHKNIFQTKEWGYRVVIHRNGKRIFLKRTKTLEEAITARDEFLNAQ